MFITSNATRGLAQYRALQSRIHPSVTAVEAFEVLKLGFGNDFQLLTSHQESTNIPTSYKKTLSQETLKWWPIMQETLALNTMRR
jgi:hypothetical protein